ncbi:MAG: hypothetical protein MHM6MM_003830 [Cercozoa sp. M6MM]
MRSSNTCELVFEDCVVPKENVLGPLHGGVTVLMSGLDYERLVLSGGPVGLMQAAFETSLAYSQERKQFGKPIGEFQLMQGKLADMYVELSQCRSYLYSVARAVDQSVAEGRNDGHQQRRMDCAGVILRTAEAATQMALDSIQVLGGNGYINEYPTGRYLRDAKLYEIGAGTSEIRRMLIGRELNKMHW